MNRTPFIDSSYVKCRINPVFDMAKIMLSFNLDPVVLITGVHPIGEKDFPLNDSV
jgi:hypothetical protein